MTRHCKQLCHICFLHFVHKLSEIPRFLQRLNNMLFNEFMSVTKGDLFYKNNRGTFTTMYTWYKYLINLKSFMRWLFYIIKKFVRCLSSKVLNSARYSNLKLYRLKINPTKCTKAHFSHLNSYYVSQSLIKIISFLK